MYHIDFLCSHGGSYRLWSKGIYFCIWQKQEQYKLLGCIPYEGEDDGSFCIRSVRHGR